MSSDSSSSGNTGPQAGLRRPEQRPQPMGGPISLIPWECRLPLLSLSLPFAWLSCERVVFGLVGPSWPFVVFRYGVVSSMVSGWTFLLRSRCASASRIFDVPWARAPTSRHSVGTCHGRFAMARWARFRFVLLRVYWFSLFLCVGPVVELSDVGLSDCFGNGFSQRLGKF